MRWRRLFALPSRRPGQIARDVDEELAFHLEMRERALIDQGLSPAEARTRARREFGDLEAARGRIAATDLRNERHLRFGTWLAEARADAVFAVRQALRLPAVSFLAVIALAAGIGSSVTIYSGVHGILRAPLPYPEPDRLVVVQQFDRNIGAPVHLAPLNFADWKERSRSFAHFAIAEPYGYDLTGAGDPVRLSAINVTAGFFEVLGARPLHGRTFAPPEHEAGAARVVVLGHRAWAQRFASDPGIVGRTLVLEGTPYQVIGIMGPRFDLPWITDVYAPRPLPTAAARDNRVSTYLRGYARLEAGVTLAAAQEEGDRIAAALATEYPAANRQMGARVTSLHEHLTGRVRPLLLTLMAAVLAVLLIACANVTNLLLARASARRRELAVRAALGAGRGRLARQLLVEAGVLAFAGLAGGLALAWAGVRALHRFAPADLPRASEIAIDLPVLAFALGLGLLATIVAGLVPALQQSRADAADVLRQSGAVASRRRLAATFVSGQVAVALVLLIGAGLLLRSYARLLREDPGFRPEGVLALTMHVWDRYPDPAARDAFVNSLLARLEAIPGVRAAAAANALPMSNEGSEMDPPFLIAGQPVPTVGDEPTAILTIVTPRYFAAMAIGLRGGRVFTSADDAGAVPVAVIGATLARRFFAGQDPVGQQILSTQGGRRVSRTIVGVVNDVRHNRLDEAPRAEIYVPLAQRPFGSLSIVVRGEPGRAAQLLPPVQAATWAVAPGLAFDGVEELERRLADTLAPRRFLLALCAAFAAVALLLALVGIYGAMSFSVSQRSGEIGVRMALGARAGRVEAMVVREGLLIAVAGVASGVLAALALTRLIRGLLFNVAPADPLTYATLVALMLVTAAGAAWLPARRAAKVDPVSAMRS